MGRYIDADAFIKEIVNIQDLRRLSLAAIGAALAITPTADVVEVVHGKWVVCDAPPPTWWYECSICHKAGNVEYNYCPNCGADMRGER